MVRESLVDCLNLLHGPPGSGKTLRLCQIASDLLKQKKTVIIFTPQPEEIRMIAKIFSVELADPQLLRIRIPHRGLDLILPEEPTVILIDEIQQSVCSTLDRLEQMYLTLRNYTKRTANPVYITVQTNRSPL
jgi:predicted ATP-dependent serine protease